MSLLFRDCFEELARGGVESVSLKVSFKQYLLLLLLPGALVFLEKNGSFKMKAIFRH